MRTYYLFIIKDEYYKLYKKNNFILYKILESLYNLKHENLVFGISFYHQLCNIFASKLLENYIKEKVPYKIINKNIIKIPSLLENTSILIEPSRLIVYTDTKYPEIFKILNIYNKKIFVADFINENYFWLSDKIVKNNEKNHILN